MATNTYVALATHTLSSAVTSYTFTSIPQTYTDLVIISSNLTCTGAYTLTAQLNGDTGSNYSWTVMAGNGSTSTSLRAANDTRGLCFGAYINGMSSTVPSVAVSTILNYSNTTTYKTSLSRLSTASLEVDASSSLWRSTAAVTSIKLMSSNPLGNLKIGTTFTIYGIKAQVTPGTAKATGGTITYDQSGNVIHTFTSSGTFTPSEALSCDYLVVAGGGGTANNFSYYSGGGGAGGLRSSVSSTGGGGSLESKLQFELSTAYTVTVGAGGAFGNSANGTSGGDSSISGTGITTVTSIGGGFSSYYSGGNPDNGGAGGSGGGAGSTNGPPYSAAGGAGTSGQGYAGGAAYGSDCICFWRRRRRRWSRR
jgi:hypothetical protein